MPYVYVDDSHYGQSAGPSYGDVERLKKRLEALEQATGHVPPPEPKRHGGTMADLGEHLRSMYMKRFLELSKDD